MKNRYKIIEDYVVIYITRKDGNKFEALIDLEDFGKVNSMTWHASWNTSSGGFYVEHCKYLGYINDKPAYKTILMHDIIMNPDENQVVDHVKPKSGLDNRKNNLRLASVSKNGMNRGRKNKNNTSGFRNVCKIKDKWVVQLQINGKNKILGKFDELSDAGEYAELMRQEYYEGFSGNT